MRYFGIWYSAITCIQSALNFWWNTIYAFCCFKNHICKEKVLKAKFPFCCQLSYPITVGWNPKKSAIIKEKPKIAVCFQQTFKLGFLKRFSYKSNGARVQSFIRSVTFIFSLLCLCHIVTSIPVFLDGRQINCQKLQSGFSDFKKLGSVKYVMHFEGERSIKVYCRALSVRIGIIGVLKENLFDCS